MCEHHASLEEAIPASPACVTGCSTACEQQHVRHCAPLLTYSLTVSSRASACIKLVKHTHFWSKLSGLLQLSSPFCDLKPFDTPPCTDDPLTPTWSSCQGVKQLALLSCHFLPLQDTIFRYTSKADVLKVELEEAEWLYGVPAAEALEDPERVRTVPGCSAAQGG